MNRATNAIELHVEKTARSASRWSWISRALFAVLILATLGFGGYLAAANAGARAERVELLEQLVDRCRWRVSALGVDSPRDLTTPARKDRSMSTPHTRAEAKAVAAAAAPWYPAQRALRSIVGALVVLIPLANGLAAAAVAYLGSQTDVTIPPVVFVWLNAIVAGTALVIGLVSRLMAVPGVNGVLQRVGLGTAPNGAVVLEKDDAGTYALVVPDPKAPTAPALPAP